MLTDEPTNWRNTGVLLSLALSLVVHGVGVWFAAHVDLPISVQPTGGMSYPPPPADGSPIIVELPAVLDEAKSFGLEDPSKPVESANVPSTGLAGATNPSPELGQSGRAGDGIAPNAPRNLATAVDRETLDDDVRDHLDREQEERRKTDSVSSGSEWLRVPVTILSFVPSGRGFRYGSVARKDVAPAFQPPKLAQPTPADLAGGESRPVVSKPARNAEVGKFEVVGALRTNRGPAGKPAKKGVSEGKAAETADADRALADAMRGLVATSSPKAEVVGGDGRGGALGVGDPGIGASTGEGSHGAALGDGTGDFSRDPRATAYFRSLSEVMAKLLEKTFPHEAELDLRSGTVIVELTLQRSGSVTVVVARESGFPQFDRNVVAALQRGVLPPMPDAIVGPVKLRTPIHGGFRLDGRTASSAKTSR